MNELVKLMNNYYGTEEKNIFYSFCPYRVCPLGAHIDHQKGNVTGFAIDYGITIAYTPSNDHFFEAVSTNFSGRKGDSILDLPDKKGDWADYIRGTVAILRKHYGIDHGIKCVIDGSLPIGGISSSAAVIIAFMKALCNVNEIELSDSEIIHLAQEVENSYVGVNCGTLDQSCEILSKKNHLLYLDTSTGSYELIPQSEKMDSYKIAIIFSGVKRTLVGSAYNTRIDELKSAANALKSYKNITLTSYKDTVLRDVPYEVFLEFGKQLPKNFYKRCLHYYEEMERVNKGVKAWREGNINEFGKLSFASGDSSINNYEAGSRELIAIHEIMKTTDGIYGGRFSGAGFKGCCLAIIDPEYEDSIREEITKRYLSLFPEYRNSFNIFYCNTADGCEFNKVIKR